MEEDSKNISNRKKTKSTKNSTGVEDSAVSKKIFPIEKNKKSTKNSTAGVSEKKFQIEKKQNIQIQTSRWGWRRTQKIFPIEKNKKSTKNSTGVEDSAVSKKYFQSRKKYLNKALRW